MNSQIEMINSIVDRINLDGCRVTLPYHEPSPLVVLFEGDFSGASYIPVYPSTLYIYGMNGQVSVSGIKHVAQIAGDKYVIVYGGEEQVCDIMVKILE